MKNEVCIVEQNYFLLHFVCSVVFTACSFWLFLVVCFSYCFGLVYWRCYGQRFFLPFFSAAILEICRRSSSNNKFPDRHR